MMGAQVTLVGPPTLIPRERGRDGRARLARASTRSPTADVINVLRMQSERMAEGANCVPSLREYFELGGSRRSWCGQASW